MNFKIKIGIFLFILTALFFFLSGYNKSYAFVMADDGYTVSCSSCIAARKPANCYTAANKSCSSCGSNCDCANRTRTQDWSKYVAVCRRVSAFSCDWAWVIDPATPSCSTADKCTAAQPYLNYGTCSCTAGGIYKTCCNGSRLGANCSTLAVDRTNPPYEGVCPSGTSTVVCGVSNCTVFRNAGYYCTGTSCGSGACQAIFGSNPPPPPPPPPTPTCNSGISCGSCTLSSGTCGGGSQSCTYTTYTGGGACNQTAAPSQGCTIGCSADSSCVSNSCVCNTPAAPTNLSPSGSIPAGTRNITWSPVSGITTYALRVDDLSNGWTGTCSSVNPGDVCNDNVTSTSYSYNFLAGRSYNIWVHATASCGAWSAYTLSSVTVSSVATIFAYNDFNGNGVRDASDTPSSGKTVTVTGQGAGSYTTNASGQVVINNVPSGNSTIRVTIPSGWSSTTTNPRTITLPPSQTVNFGIRPPAPTCSGGLTANPITVGPGGASTLTAVGCTSPTGGTLSYTYFEDSTIIGDTVTNNNTNTSRWTAPNPYWTQRVASPSVAVCNPGGGLCRNYGATITIVPRFSISGNVFIDQNKDLLQNGSEVNYTGGITISPNPAGAIVTYNAGNYTVSNMPGGQYTIYYSNGPPAGYIMTYPVGIGTPSFTVRVGNASTGGACLESSNSATCDANGNISLLRYGISNSIPWIQSTGGNITGSNISNPSGGGISNNVASGQTCGGVTNYTSITGAGTTPGIIHSGSGAYYFCPPLACQNLASSQQWVIGGSSYPDTYALPSNVIRTSYNYIDYIARQSAITPIDIANYCGGGGITNCQLSFASTDHGVFKANGSLTLTGPIINFPADKDFVILVNGDLNIQTEVSVPIGSTTFFTTSGNINVASSVGNSDIALRTVNVQGYYSSDKSFYVQSLDSTGKGLNCPTSDRRLNISGAIVVNAALGGGSFVNQRDLCAGDLQCPAFAITERPDFVLNTPDFFKTTRRVWQEIAP